MISQENAHLVCFGATSYPRRSRSSESDGLGSVIGEVGGEDSNHNVVKSTCKLDVYGAVRQSSGASESNHKFVGSLGHTSESSTDLIYMRARYYDPSVGRFISEDPAHNGNNWYSYCDNNPINNIDRDGKAVDPAEALFKTALSAASGMFIGILVGYLMWQDAFHHWNPEFQPNILVTLGLTELAAATQNAILYVASIIVVSGYKPSVKTLARNMNIAFYAGFVAGLYGGEMAAMCEYLTSDAFSQ